MVETTGQRENEQQDTIATINYDKIGDDAYVNKREVSLVSLLECQSQLAAALHRAKIMHSQKNRKVRKLKLDD